MFYFKIIGNEKYPYRIGLNALNCYDKWTCSCCEIFKYTTAYHIFDQYSAGDRICILRIPLDACYGDNDYGRSKYSDKIIIDKIMPLWDIYTLQYLVSMGMNINHGLTTSSMCGHLHFVKYFISVGAKESINDAWRGACNNKHSDIAQYLVSVGANATSTSVYDEQERYIYPCQAIFRRIHIPSSS